MFDTDDLRDQIYSNMQLKTDEELKFILEQNDHEEWSDTAFEVVRQILIQRTGEVPAAPVASSGMPAAWKNISWLKVYNKCIRMVNRSKPFLLVFGFIYLLITLGTGVFAFIYDETNGLSVFLLCILFGGGLFAYFLRSYLRVQRSTLIAAEARVYLKHSDSIDRNGTVYHVEFAIRSAFALSGKGELLANDDWKGHHTLTVLRSLYEKIEEQEIVNLVFLSTDRVFGLLEDFTGHGNLNNNGSGN